MIVVTRGDDKNSEHGEEDDPCPTAVHVWVIFPYVHKCLYNNLWLLLVLILLITIINLFIFTSFTVCSLFWCFCCPILERKD